MDIERLRLMLQKSNNIVFFGGAGVSTESNIPDFRSSSGLYSDNQAYTYSPETILSHSFFRRHPKIFFEFYKKKMIHKEAQPNDAHLALEELEKAGKLKAIITQNIDGLHQQAGSKNVLELHGSIHRNYCRKCKKFFDLDYILSGTELPICDVCSGLVKPDVVLYEESLDMEVLRASIQYLQEADVLIIGGTSLTVYPAANLVDYYRGDKLVLINKTETSQDDRACLSFKEGIGKVLKDSVL